MDKNLWTGKKIGSTSAGYFFVSSQCTKKQLYFPLTRLDVAFPVISGQCYKNFWTPKSYKVRKKDFSSLDSYFLEI